MLKQFMAWVLVLAAVAGTVGGLGLFKYRQIEAGIAAGAAFPEPVEAVGSAISRKGTWSVTTRAIGTVVALQQVEIRNEIAGVVSKLGFMSGASVKAGQVLVEFDTRQEEAALTAAQAEVRLAESTLERRKGLRNSPAFSEQEFDKARSESAAALARAKGLAVVIDKKKIVAPFDGQVGITDLQPGAYLDVGTRIVTLQGTSPDAYVDFALPQDEAAMIRKGTQVTLRNGAVPGSEIIADIVADDNSVDRNNRTVRFRAKALGIGALLRPGMFVDVIAITAPPRDAVFVPLTAVRRSAGGAFVYVLAEKDGKLRAREQRVTLGPVQGDDIAVVSGLESGLRVAAAGSFKLRDGALVALSQPTAPQAGATN